MRWTLAIVAALALGGAVLAQEAPDTHQALRARIEQRFDVVPLTDGVALRPKGAIEGVRLIEIGEDGTVAINGDPVTGRELRQRLGRDADAVLRLSQLSDEARRGLFERAQPPAPPEPVERPSEPPATTSETETPSERARDRRIRTSGDRVQIFGDVRVAENESLSGQVVAVIGSVHIDGEVGQQVVAVLGSVHLGPRSVVRGDVVSVGGRVYRAEGSEVHGQVTQVAFSNAGMPVHVGWPDVWWGRPHFAPWGAARMVGTVFRMLLLIILAGLAYVIARPTVDAAAARVADNPVQATFVGLAAEILVVPTLFLTALILVLTVIGIPLLLLLPFVILLLLVMALLGFAGVAGALGTWLRSRTGLAIPEGFAAVAAGVVIIVLPLLIGRAIGLGGWALAPFGFLFIATGIAFEFLAWTAGFGAVLTNAFSKWQARRATRIPPPPPPPPQPVAPPTP